MIRSIFSTPENDHFKRSNDEHPVNRRREQSRRVNYCPGLIWKFCFQEFKMILLAKLDFLIQSCCQSPFIYCTVESLNNQSSFCRIVRRIDSLFWVGKAQKEYVAEVTWSSCSASCQLHFVINAALLVLDLMGLVCKNLTSY